MTIQFYKTMAGGASGLAPSLRVAVDLKEIAVVVEHQRATDGKPYGCNVVLKNGVQFHLDSGYDFVVDQWTKDVYLAE